MDAILRINIDLSYRELQVIKGHLELDKENEHGQFYHSALQQIKKAIKYFETQKLIQLKTHFEMKFLSEKNLHSYDVAKDPLLIAEMEKYIADKIAESGN